MEMTIQAWREMKKELRRRFSAVGWILLIYYGILNAAVFLTAFFEMTFGMMGALLSGQPEQIPTMLEKGMKDGWGYVVAVAVGLLALLIWKKPSLRKAGERGKPMTPGSFLSLLCLFLSGQAVYQLLTTFAELILNGFGLSMLDGLESLAMDTGSFSMFLYAGILAPVTEEILFRGVVQRALMPYGRRFAIFCSAFAFGIFHGNLLQSPYAFLMGLVLGYTASEYSIAWSMVLHMINNLVLADLLPRLLSGLPDITANLIVWAVILAFTVGAVAVIIAKRRSIGEYFRADHKNGVYLSCFFTSPGMVILMVLMGISMVFTFMLMLSPL